MKGDKVVCINNTSWNKIKIDLTIGKIYVILYNGFLAVVNDIGSKAEYDTCRFISLKEYRKKKLEKICGHENN